MFSERKLTEERKQTVLYQKTEQPVETSCKHKLTANGGTNGRCSLSLKHHSEEKKTQPLSHGVHLKEVERLFEISCQVYLFQQKGKLRAAFFLVSFPSLSFYLTRNRIHTSYLWFSSTDLKNRTTS